MKVNYRTHPVLQKLESESLGKLPILEQDIDFFKNNIEPIKLMWANNVHNFSNEVNIISKPFLDAVGLAWVKLRDLWSDIISNKISDIDIDGTFILNKTVYMFDYHYKSIRSEHIVNLIMFDKSGVPIALFIQGKGSDECNMWISKKINIHNNKDGIEGWILDNFLMLIIISFFKSYAQVETKYLPAGKRVKDVSCKYINETKLNLTFLDSKWFTTLVKSDAFKVRGHFRLQPKKKEGKWTHELIWINDFMKTGYTAPARKLNQVAEL